MIRQLRLGSLILAILLCSLGSAQGDPDVNSGGLDRALAGMPIIVVGRYVGAPAKEIPISLKSFFLEDENSWGDRAYDSAIQVDRVIVGHGSPGTMNVFLPVSPPDWGQGLRGATEGDVDPTKPCIWFLSYPATPSKPGKLLPLVEAVQPLSDEPFFLAFIHHDSAAIEKLLTGNQDTILRTLNAIAGRLHPMMADRPSREETFRSSAMSSLAPSVARLCGSSDETLCLSAMLTLDVLDGDLARKTFRPLLKARSAETRTVAACLLARDRDEASIGDMAAVASNMAPYAESMRDASARDLIETFMLALRDWKSPKTAPILINMLQSSHIIDYWNEHPILKGTKVQMSCVGAIAHRMLADLTSVSVPYDRAAAMKAFESGNLQSIGDRQFAWQGYATKDSKGYVVAVKNLGNRTIWLPKDPTYVVEVSKESQSGADEGDSTGFSVTDAPTKAQFVAVPPKGFWKYRLETGIKDGKILLLFADSGAQFGYEGWMGTVAIAGKSIR